MPSQPALALDTGPAPPAATLCNVCLQHRSVRSDPSSQSAASGPPVRADLSEVCGGAGVEAGEGEGAGWVPTVGGPLAGDSFTAEPFASRVGTVGVVGVPPVPPRPLPRPRPRPGPRPRPRPRSPDGDRGEPGDCGVVSCCSCIFLNEKCYYIVVRLKTLEIQ